jgi:archaellin
MVVRRIKILLMALVAAVFVLITFVGCKAQKVVNHTEKNDSSSVVKTHEVLKIEDKTKETPTANIQTKIATPCDSNGHLKPFTQEVNVGKAHSKIRIVHDSIYVDCQCDSTVDRLRTESLFKDSLNSQLQKQVSDTRTETIKEKAFVPWYFWALAGFLFCLGAVIGFSFSHLIKL